MRSTGSGSCWLFGVFARPIRRPEAPARPTPKPIGEASPIDQGPARHSIRLRRAGGYHSRLMEYPPRAFSSVRRVPAFRLRSASDPASLRLPSHPASRRALRPQTWQRVRRHACHLTRRQDCFSPAVAPPPLDFKGNTTQPRRTQERGTLRHPLKPTSGIARTHGGLRECIPQFHPQTAQHVCPAPFAARFYRPPEPGGATVTTRAILDQHGLPGRLEFHRQGGVLVEL